MKNLLRLKVIADENIDNRIIKGLRNKGFNIMSVLEDYRGVSDKEVIELARNKDAIVLTEDKDFGNWVFAHKEETKGVIYLRYTSEEVNTICNSLVYLFSKYGEDLYKKFVVIKANKFRVRNLP